MRYAFLLLVGAAGCASSPQAARSQPNLILFLSDDHGALDSPVYGLNQVRTPNMERLAAAGTVFTRAFVGSPSCVPSRAILMSGLMSVRNGAEPNHSGLKPGIKTLPSYLTALGYRVAHFGKSHFQPKANYPDLEFVPSEVKGPDLDPAAVEKWLAARTDSAKPVCLIVCCHSPHVPWPPNAGYDPAALTLPPKSVDTPETREHRAQYLTDVTNMDRQLGQVYDAVVKHLPTNTLFIYASDHGAQWPFGKWNLYDSGIRVPFIAVWPGVLKAGARTAAMVSFVDLTPTFIELAGGTPPGDLDGRSFAAVLQGRSDRHRDELFATQSGDGDMNVYPTRAVRTGRFKYLLNLHPEFEFGTHIDRSPRETSGLAYWKSWDEKAKSDPRAGEIVKRYRERPREELYDVESDPQETTNLAALPEHQERLRELREKVERWMKQQGDAARVFGKPRLLNR